MEMMFAMQHRLEREMGGGSRLVLRSPPVRTNTVSTPALGGLGLFFGGNRLRTGWERHRGPPHPYRFNHGAVPSRT